MQTTPSRVDVLAAVFVVVLVLGGCCCTAHGDGDTGQTDPTPDPYFNYSQVSCTFWHDTCGWENVGGPNYTLTWEKKKDYMKLSMKNARDDDKGRLASPWLHPQTATICQLQFQYYIRSSSRKDCQLSLFRQTSSADEELIWMTQNSTGLVDFSPPIRETINCSGERFRMVFEGKGSCHVRWYNEIDVKAIQFIVHPEDMAPPTGTASPESQIFTIEHTYTGTPDIPVPNSTGRDAHTSSANTDTSSQPGVGTSSVTDRGGARGPQVKENQGDREPADLGAGALAGIIIAVIIVLVLVVVLVVFVIVRRRRRRDASDKDSTNRQMSRGVANASYMLDSDELTGNHNTNRRKHPGNTPGDDYELAEPLPPYNIFSQHEDDDLTRYHDIRTSHSPFVPSPVSGDHNNGAHGLRVTTSTSSVDDDHPYLTVEAAPDTGSDGAYDQTNRAPLPAIPDHTYDNTNRAPLPVIPDHTYDHTNAAPAVSNNNGDNSYDHLHVKSMPGSVTTPHEDTYHHANVRQPHQSDLDDYTLPQTEMTTENGRNIQDPTSSSSERAGAISARAGSTDYEVVDEELGEMRSSSADDDAYNRLDVTGERRGEGVVGENVYDHAKDDSYDRLREDSRRRQQRHLAQEDYSHI